MRLFGPRTARTRLFYASDIHGSEKCFLKFVNAARFYRADVLVLGGDLTGKVISRSEVIENADGRVVDLGAHELVGMGYANPTPFHSPRELPEAELESRLEALIATMREPERAIFAIHVPPVNSGLDMAPRL